MRNCAQWLTLLFVLVTGSCVSIHQEPAKRYAFTMILNGAHPNEVLDALACELGANGFVTVNKAENRVALRGRFGPVGLHGPDELRRTLGQDIVIGNTAESVKAILLIVEALSMGIGMMDGPRSAEVSCAVEAEGTGTRLVGSVELLPVDV
jgi:hypothetical protein